MRRLLHITGLLLALNTASGLAAEDAMNFEGVCDISGAVPIGEGHMLAASDEANIHYSFSQRGGFPYAQRDLNPL